MWLAMQAGCANRLSMESAKLGTDMGHWALPSPFKTYGQCVDKNVSIILHLNQLKDSTKSCPDFHSDIPVAADDVIYSLYGFGIKYSL